MAQAGGSEVYPVRLEIDIPERSGRFWAIPLLGLLAKAIVLIPHLLILYVLGLAIEVCQLVIWIWVLFGGRYPRWAYGLVSGYMRWYVRVGAFFLGLTDRYPPFQM